MILKVPDKGKVSDGHHTFDDLYNHREALFRLICSIFPENSWKSKYHDDGIMFDGNFIVGFKMGDCDITYHYDLKFWNSYKVKALDRAPKWDGHSPDDVILRLRRLADSIFIQGEINNENN